jgi:hypothetical protein
MNAMEKQAAMALHSERRRRPVFAGIAIVGLALSGCSSDETRYSENFSEEHFAKIEIGATAGEVSSALGRELLRVDDPFPETWLYGADERGAYFRAFDPPESVTFDQAGVVLRASGRAASRVSIGQTKEAVRSILGLPARIVPARSSVLWFSKPGESGRYSARGLALGKTGTVVEKFSYSTWE